VTIIFEYNINTSLLFISGAFEDHGCFFRTYNENGF